MPKQPPASFELWDDGKQVDCVAEGACDGQSKHTHRDDDALETRGVGVPTTDVAMPFTGPLNSLQGLKGTLVDPLLVTNPSSSSSQNHDQPVDTCDAESRLKKAVVSLKSKEKRLFGREVNTNIVDHLSKKPTSKTKTAKKAVIEQDLQSFLSPTVDLPPRQIVTTADPLTMDVKLPHDTYTVDATCGDDITQDSTVSGIAQVATQAGLKSDQKVRCTLKLTDKTNVSRQRKDSGVKKTTAPKIRPTKPLPKTKAAKKLQTSSKSTASTKRPVAAPAKPQAFFIPVFAKRTPVTHATVPASVDHDTYEAHLNAIPSPTNLICICKKPARTYNVEIAQCANQACSIRWFHRACLDKRCKLSIRFGTMVCMVCRGEKEIKEIAGAEGWNTGSLEEEVTKLVDINFGRTLADGLPGVGGVKNVIHAYGIGVPMVELQTVVAKKNERALGSLSMIGYAQSRPEQFVEAYENAEANRKAADEEWDYLRTVDTENDDEFDDDEEAEEEDYSTEESEDEDSLDPLKYWRGAEIVHAI
ncbi:hypothetical protein IAQ61_005036 [Plenodomus lingam]|nr:hypothetical protein IAQ61_005036 [Plenodomus lingam]